MNTKNAVRINATTKTEGKYKRLYQDRMELDELDFLNHRTEERVAQMQKGMWEKEKKAELEQKRQERKFNAILNLVAIIIVYAVIVTALCVLSFTDNLDWMFTAIVSMLLTIACAFRAGYIWHEVKG